MGVAPALLVGVCFVGCAIPSQGRPAKRVVDGDPLWSQEDFRTYHFVHLRDAWGCTTNQATHELGGCQEQNICGGTLVHPEFVITAQHCVSYWEFYMRPSHQIYNTDAIKNAPGVSLQDLGFFNYVERGARVIPNNPQSRHAFYSNVALFAGSTDYFEMTQKRHAHRVFPHPVYHSREHFSLIEHDIAIIQACEPFEMTSTVKTPKVKPPNNLLTQWASIVTRSAACLFVGFGLTGDDSAKVFHNVRKNYAINTQYLRSTWRQMDCPAKCRVEYDPDEAHLNPCIGCSAHIPPRTGTCLQGDSGGPVVCDGWYIGIILGGWYEPENNITQNWIYPLHCIRKAFTPEAFEYYRNAPAVGPGRFVPLLLEDVTTEKTYLK